MTGPSPLGEEQATARGAGATFREIRQQPEVCREAPTIVRERRGELDASPAPLLDRRDLRIVVTGAGTSACAGGVVAPAVARAPRRRIGRIATDLVSNPRQHLAEDVPTPLVSFARSGDSPQLISSVTAMVLSALLALPGDAPRALAAAADAVLADEWVRIAARADDDARRLVFLGSGSLAALAQEAALKVLELTRAYDLDIVRELCAASGPARVLAVAGEAPDDTETVLLPGLAGIGDAWLAVGAVVVAQILALSLALRVATTPDDPFPGGSVDRVVRGVRIHPLPAAPMQAPDTATRPGTADGTTERWTA